MRRSRKGEIHGKASQDEGIIINGDKIPMDSLLPEENQQNVGIWNFIE